MHKGPNPIILYCRPYFFYLVLFINKKLNKLKGEILGVSQPHVQLSRTHVQLSRVPHPYRLRLLKDIFHTFNKTK